MNKEISIVVFANAKDFFLTKICIASIRHFYPDVEIFIVKDELNGKFSTKLLERTYNAKIFKLSKKHFGWSAAKIHFLIENNEDKLFLCLDSDIVFIGPVLEKFENLNSDFCISPEYCEEPIPIDTQSVYFDMNKIKNNFEKYRFPGYFFNAGQTLVNPSKFSRKYFDKLFEPDRYPYYTNMKDFPMVDQSILNFVIPILETENKIIVSKIEFMNWSVSFFSVKENNELEILNENHKYLVHYAGDTRTTHLNLMKGNKLLYFFKSSYFQRLNVLQRNISNLQDLINENRIKNKFFHFKNKLIYRNE